MNGIPQLLFPSEIMEAMATRMNAPINLMKEASDRLEAANRLLFPPNPMKEVFEVFGSMEAMVSDGLEAMVRRTALPNIMQEEFDRLEAATRLFAPKMPDIGALYRGTEEE